MNGYTTPLAKFISRLPKSARIELLNFHLANGNAHLALIDGGEHIRIDLPTGEYAVVSVA